MSADYNPYSPPQTQQLYPRPAPGPDASPYRRFPDGQLPDLGKAFNETLNDFTRDIGPYAIAGLGLIVVTIPISLIMIVVMYGFMAAVALGAVGMESASGGSDDAAWLPVALGFGSVGGIFLMIALMMVAMAPLTASLSRAVAQHQRGERRLEFGASFSTFWQDLGPVCGVMALLGLLSCVAAIFCYVPALAVAFFLTHAFTLAALFGTPAIPAVKASVAVVRTSLGWSAKYFGLSLLINMIASNIPVIGPMFTMAFILRVSRELLGDGAQPVLELRQR
jgi:hypothetical protein